MNPWMNFNFTNLDRAELWINEKEVDATMNGIYTIKMTLSDDSGQSSPNTYTFSLSLFVIGDVDSIALFDEVKIELTDFRVSCGPMVSIVE